MEKNKVSEYIYGRNAVLQALRAGSDIRRVLVARGTKRDGMMGEALEIAQHDEIPIVEVEREALDRMVKRGSLHQGIVAEAGEFEYVELDEILTAAQAHDEPPFLLLLDNVQYVTNFGALLRTAEIIGVHGVIIPEHRQAGVTAQVRKASAGAVDFLNVAQVTNLAHTIDELKAQNVWVVGIEEAPKAIPYNKGDYTIPIAFVVGSEVDGLRRLTRDKCDYMVQLPMWGKTPSLNVSVAGSVVLYEDTNAESGKGDWTKIMTESIETRIDRLHAAGMIDMHFDLLMDLYEKRKRENVLRDDFQAQLDAGGIGVIGAAIYLDEKYLPEQALRVGLDQIARLYVEVDSNPHFAICRTYADIAEARQNGQIAVLITMEGVEPIGTDLNLLRVFYELGLRSVGLTHARRNMAADGGLFAANTSSRHGLAPFGKVLVQEMEKLNILIDLAHLNPAGVDDVLALTSKPIIFSHTNPRKFFDLDRNASDDHLRAVGAHGGVIGLNGALVGATVPQATIDMFIDNVEYAIELTSVDSVAVGFDFFKFVWDQWTPEEQKAFAAYLMELPFIPDMNNHSHAKNLTRRLIERGWKDADISKLLYGNWMRVFELVL